MLRILIDQSTDNPMDKHIDTLINQIPDMIKDSPDIVEMEEVGRADTDYKYMVSAIKNGLAHRLIASECELSRMGGEYSRLRVLPG